MICRKKAVTFLVLALVLSASVGAIAWLEFTPWYSVSFESLEGGTIVRFAQPNARLVSQDFFLTGTAAAPGTYPIQPSGSVIPGCVFEFSDHAPLGGRHKIRIGRVLFDVMEAQIVVDGKPHGWRRRTAF